jgi:hypothetical protein
MRNLWRTILHGAIRNQHQTGKGSFQNRKPGTINFPGDPANLNFQESPELKSEEPAIKYKSSDYEIRFPDSRSKIPFIGLFM